MHSFRFKKYLICFGLAILSVTPSFASGGSEPSGLSVNFILHPEQVFSNGYLVDVPLLESINRKEQFQFTEIAQKKPFFGWRVNSNKANTVQSAYEIVVYANDNTPANAQTIMWASGKVLSNDSINVKYNGKPLAPNSIYSWKVKTWNNYSEESTFSDIQQFKTAPVLLDYSTARYPLQKKDDYPVLLQRLKKSNDLFIDFGKAGFGRLRLTLFGTNAPGNVTIHVGEAVKDGRVDRKPAGTIRYSSTSLALKPGWNTYIVTVAPDELNTSADAILMPTYIGEVTPFRYAEIENYSEKNIGKENVVRETVNYPFNDQDSYFESSNNVLNQIWELSKYSVKATSFAGIYVDGDRERIPYEADALINQLSHYSVAREFNLARHTHEYLIKNATWPTEWILQSVLVAWNDYLYTGNKDSLEYFYDDLKHKSLIVLADEKDGLISTKTKKLDKSVMGLVHAKWDISDIVDWPHAGVVNKIGETDGFIFTEKNTVVNAFHYRAIFLLSEISKVLDRKDDHQFFSAKEKFLKKQFNDKLVDKNRGIYIDGVGTTHSSLHANMFPLLFGLVAEENRAAVISFVKSRGMACSVYGAQFLLEAIYDANNAQYGESLLTSTGKRSWFNMIKIGSTISLEAWDNEFKPNLDWNHAWGAAPANIIPRKIMGIEPIERGFRKIQIKPQPANLKFAKIKYPTILGDVLVSFTNDPGKKFILDITSPANSTVKVYLPKVSERYQIMVDNEVATGIEDGAYVVVDNVGSGSHLFSISSK
ncbi:MAG: alpha-L-rhamnosidase C-terminal domain-containing protein [Pseudomonadota bacterium]